MKTALCIASPSQHEATEPATIAGFSFLKHYGDKMGTKIKYGHYKPAKLYDKGVKWFVYYSYLNPETGRMQRFKVYENLNYIEDLTEKRQQGELMVKAVNYGLSTGWNPFRRKELVSYVKNWTLNQGLNYFKQKLITRGLRKRSIQTYESVLRMLQEGMRPMLNEDINTLTKQKILFALSTVADKKSWSNSTFNNNLTFVRSIFNFLIEADILKDNPAAKIKPMPESISRNKYFGDATFDKIKKNADPALLDFILFLYHTGTRPNEARQLRYENINYESKLLLVPAGISKNKKDDYVPLSEYILNKYKGEGLIFGTSVNYYSQKFNELKKKLKLPADVNLYSVKHTRAIHLAQDGASPYAIMQLFRHSSLEITMKYLRDLGLTVNREAADKAR